jgi:hypothetical protein
MQMNVISCNEARFSGKAGSAANEFLIYFSITARHNDGMDVGWEILQEFDPLILNLNQISSNTSRQLLVLVCRHDIRIIHGHLEK